MSWRTQVGRHLKELRIVISSTGEVSSNGAREWILRRTEEMRSLNPNFPFYIREGLNIEPYMQVEYDWGETTEHTLAGMTSDEVDAEIKKIVTSKMNDAQYQGQREHRPPMWLRRPPDIVDEMEKPCEAIPYVLPVINNYSEETGICPPGRLPMPEKVLQEQMAALNAMGEKIIKDNMAEAERKAKRDAYHGGGKVTSITE